VPIQSIGVEIAMPWGQVCISAEIAGLRQALSQSNKLSVERNGVPTLQLTLRPGAVATGQKDQQTARADLLINLWPNHVLMCAAGFTLQSVAVGLDGVAVLPTMAPESAKQLLAQWLTVYAQAWAKPLPVTFKAGLAFVSEQMRQANSDKEVDSDHAIDQALEKARKVFSDNYSEDSDYSRSLYVQRSFEGFEPLTEGLPIWAPMLYADLLNTACMEGGPA
jgi:exonuclease V gamma subunit